MITLPNLLPREGESPILVQRREHIRTLSWSTLCALIETAGAHHLSLSLSWGETVYHAVAIMLATAWVRHHAMRGLR